MTISSSVLFFKALGNETEDGRLVAGATLGNSLVLGVVVVDGAGLVKSKENVTLFFGSSDLVSVFFGCSSSSLGASVVGLAPNEKAGVLEVAAAVLAVLLVVAGAAKLKLGFSAAGAAGEVVVL